MDKPLNGDSAELRVVHRRALDELPNHAQARGTTGMGDLDNPLNRLGGAMDRPPNGARISTPECVPHAPGQTAHTGEPGLLRNPAWMMWIANRPDLQRHRPDPCNSAPGRG